MARTPEGAVKDRIKAVLIEFGCYFFMPVQTGYGVVGIPDFIVCFQGKFIAIETKAPGKVKDTTVLQDRNIEAIRTAGGAAFVTDNADDVRALLTKLKVAHPC